MLEVAAIPGAEIVQPGFALRRAGKTVLGALAVAGEEPGTLAALAGQAVLLVLAELQLALTVHHLHQRLRVDVAQLVLREDEVVARIDIAVELHYPGVSAGFGQHAHTGLLAHPVGQGRVEELDEHLAHVLLDPLVEQRAEERAPLFGRHGEIRQPHPVVLVHGSQVSSVRMGQDALHDGGELDVAATYLLEEAVELQRIVGIEVVHHRHGVPLHAVLVQQFDAVHHLHERGPSLLVLAILVMELLRPVDADAHQPVVLLEEAAPLVRQHRAVGLDAVFYGAASRILPLQLHGLLIESQGAHQRFPAMPGEERLRHGLRADIFLDELLQQRVAHHVLGVVLIQLALFQVITVVASQVAKGACGLQHDVERAGKRGVGCGHIVYDGLCNVGKDTSFCSNLSQKTSGFCHKTIPPSFLFPTK